jgi:predicted lipoprotein with Yx(FWY)xxD motif
MRDLDRRHKDNRARRPQRVRRGLIGISLGAVAVTGATAVAPAVSAQATTGAKQRVVEVVTRAPYGRMLATVKGLSLYTTSSGCTGGCLSAWPPLLMDKGNTIPTGVKGLGTVALTFKGSSRLQVTFHGNALYRFVGDSGTSVNGNGVSGFTVAKV